MREISIIRPTIHTKLITFIIVKNQSLEMGLPPATNLHSLF